ncbi:hypothetical protein QYE76_003489 [Lolium multiflorum]|uniref:Uncharacterized protein n=1 Tax=Lolium multiflorum TaxID=4521 RepID=A0AAD8RQD1_LOLMU|nr:hypothetical protein QYE76_003489 [Lolium multiflorum]
MSRKYGREEGRRGAGHSRPALPPLHCRPNRHCRPEHAGTAGPTKVNCISTVDLSSMDQDTFCCSDIDDAIAMEMRDSTICEMSASTICELEYIHFESMSDTPCPMDDETPIMEKKMYMVHEDDAITPCLIEDEHGGHMEPTTSTTPTSNESDYKGLLTSEVTFKRWCHLPPLHVHEDLSSRTTLFQVGGDDAARPSVFTASCASSPRRHAKVNLLLYACLESPTWNDILLHTPSYLDDRNSTTSTEGREDATETRGRKADVTEAWKRRRKKRSWTLQAGTAAASWPALPPRPALPPTQARHCRPNRHCRPEHAGTAGPTKVNCISTVDLSSMDQDTFCNSDFTPVRIWAYKYLTPSSRLGLEMN